MGIEDFLLKIRANFRCIQSNKTSCTKNHKNRHLAYDANFET